MENPGTIVGNKIIFARHLVGSTFASFLAPGMEPGAYALGSIACAIIAPIFAAAGTGLIWLFFTESQRRHGMRNFSRILWLTLLAVLGSRWQSEWVHAQVASSLVLFAIVCSWIFPSRPAR